MVTTDSLGATRELHDTTEDTRIPPMYGPFYGLREPPFDLTPDPRFLFLAPRQREALSNLRYGLSTARGFTLLVGDAGTGKTTLVRAALAAMADSPNRYVLLSNPTLQRAEFYEFMASEFGLSAGASASKTTFLSEFQRDVEARFAAGGLTGLVIDEAQSLPYELLEEIRLLGNLDTGHAKLLNIVLAGQPELAARLNEPSLRPLKQRITLRCELAAFTFAETAAYIAGRIRLAGGTPEDVFGAKAVLAVHRGSHGIPRAINVLCDNALVGGFAAQIKPIPAAIVEDVCRDFDLTPAPPPPGPPASPQAPQSVRRPDAPARPTMASRGPLSGMVAAAEEPRGFQALRRKFRFSFF